MSSIKVDSDSFELDLAFITLEKNEISKSVDKKLSKLLDNSDEWGKELKTWLKVVRRNPKIKCPTIIREAPAISLGLQLTDDIKIAKLNQIWRQNLSRTSWVVLTTIYQ